jgi:hypothetical protein
MASSYAVGWEISTWCDGCLFQTSSYHISQNQFEALRLVYVGCQIDREKLCRAPPYSEWYAPLIRKNFNSIHNCTKLRQIKRQITLNRTGILHKNHYIYSIKIFHRKSEVKKIGGVFQQKCWNRKKIIKKLRVFQHRYSGNSMYNVRSRSEAWENINKIMARGRERER